MSNQGWYWPYGTRSGTVYQTGGRTVCVSNQGVALTIHRTRGGTVGESNPGGGTDHTQN